MKSEKFSMHTGHHGGKHHHGHPHGHPTAHGAKGKNSDSGSMKEHGLSEGNTKGMKHAMPESQCQNNILHEHELQHVDYGELTGNTYNTTEYKD